MLLSTHIHICRISTPFSTYFPLIYLLRNLSDYLSTPPPPWWSTFAGNTPHPRHCAPLYQFDGHVYPFFTGFPIATLWNGKTCRFMEVRKGVVQIRLFITPRLIHFHRIHISSGWKNSTANPEPEHPLKINIHRLEGGAGLGNFSPADPDNLVISWM